MKTGFILECFVNFLLIIILLGGCSPQEQMETLAEKEEIPVRKAIAYLEPTEGNMARGTVTFTKTENGIQIVADVQGLAPGSHGFHIHQYGDCGTPDASSAGDHFNPGGLAHGAPDDEVRHAGDLGNLQAGEDSTAHYERIDSHISFSGNHSIIGRGVVVHANEDDFVSQPSGNAGNRIACGVIGIDEK